MYTPENQSYTHNSEKKRWLNSFEQKELFELSEKMDKAVKEAINRIINEGETCEDIETIGADERRKAEKKQRQDRLIKIKEKIIEDFGKIIDKAVKEE